jgi:hypothetical protein
MIMDDAPQDIKETYRYLKTEFEESKAGKFGEIMKATWDRGVDVFVDPINFLFMLLGTRLGGTGAAALRGAAGTSAAAALKVASSPAGRRGITRALHNISASNGGRAGAFEGAIWTGTENAARQDINISTEIQDAFSGGDFALSTGLGFGLGAVAGHYLGGLFGPKASNKIDETPITGHDPTREAPGVLTGGRRVDPPSRPTKMDYQRIENVDGKPTVVTKQAEVKWEPTNKKRKGKPINATRIVNSDGSITIKVDDKALRKTFSDKPWTKPQIKGVAPLKPNDIRTEEEWIMFNFFHELNHAYFLRPFKADANGKPIRDIN